MPKMRLSLLTLMAHPPLDFETKLLADSVANRLME